LVGGQRAIRDGYPQHVGVSGDRDRSADVAAGIPPPTGHRTSAEPLGRETAQCDVPATSGHIGRIDT
jgi:hypothetical protein